MNNWISIKDRLPEEGVLVQVLPDDFEDYAIFHCGEWLDIDYCDYPVIVTHWKYQEVE